VLVDAGHPHYFEWGQGRAMMDNESFIQYLSRFSEKISIINDPEAYIAFQYQLVHNRELWDEKLINKIHFNSVPFPTPSVSKKENDQVDRQSLTPAFLNSALRAMGIEYEQDDDGDYHLILPDDTVTVGLSLPSSSELRIVCIYNEPVPQAKWLEAFLACNEFHKSSKLGHAYLLSRSETEGAFVYEVWWNFENGMVSMDYLLRHTILRAIEQAGELFTKIAQECNR
jgi:hypothetical protein